MWLNDASVEDIKTFFSQTATQLIVSRTDGTILWANDSFCSWIKYTNYELQNMGWLVLSVPDNDLVADTQQMHDLSKQNYKYAVQKRYIPKNSKPELGTLYVFAFFKDNKVDYCINVWEPFKNGTAAAFDLAITSTSNMTKAINELSLNVATLTDQKEEERFLLSMYKMSLKYPKITVAIFVIIIGTTGFSNIVNTLQRLGLAPAPTVHIEEKK